MADYYPLVAKAIAGLERNTGEGRRVLYERARTALVQQLRGMSDPPLTETDITRERLALEEAIRKVEAQSIRRPPNARRQALAEAAERERARLEAEAEVKAAEAAKQEHERYRAAVQAEAEARLRAREEAEARGEVEARERARREAEAKAIAEAEARERARQEAEAKARAEAEARERARQEAEAKAIAEAEARERARREAEAKAIAEAEAQERTKHEAEERLKATLPSVKIIPEQKTRAIAFTSAGQGPLGLVPDEPVGSIDPEQSELYARMRNQLVAIVETIPSQERTQISSIVDDFLGQPPNWPDVKFKRILWLCGNALRNVLAQHDAAMADPDPHYAKLPVVAAEALRRTAETWNIVVLGDPILRDLDSKRLGPRESDDQLAELAPAKHIVVAAAEDRGITTPQAGAALQVSLVAASVPADNIHTRQAQELARGTMQNLVVQILRGGHRVAQDLQNPGSEEAKAFAKEYKAGLYKEMAAWTARGAAVGVAGAGTAVYFYGLPFFEFVVANGPWLKAYLSLAFQNPELTRIVDVVTAIRMKIVGSTAVSNI
jgi:multidrug efflux pump subunit AcrA (membrane-fusion protein)